jgi:hypothetical protein
MTFLNIKKMKIGIDLNDVIRAYTAQFASYYKKNIDRKFDTDNVDVWTNDLKEVFPFETKRDYLEFLYNDYAYEIHGCAPCMDKNEGSMLTDWCKELEDLDEVPELCIISTGEYDKTIGSTYFFLSKIGTKIRETHLFLKEDNAWDTCDVLITANPYLLSLKPESKVSIKIKTSYNEESTSDFTYETFNEFMKDVEVIDKINKELSK